ncbi:UNVERIFIED_CONTAM: hypothetical protein GTU68_024318, partial [Idotea baltica]|nr:hypothetical protein [Idotea baltica]
DRGARQNVGHGRSSPRGENPREARTARRVQRHQTPRKDVRPDAGRNLGAERREKDQISRQTPDGEDPARVLSQRTDEGDPARTRRRRGRQGRNGRTRSPHQRHETLERGQGKGRCRDEKAAQHVSHVCGGYSRAQLSRLDAVDPVGQEISALKERLKQRARDPLTPITYGLEKVKERIVEYLAVQQRQAKSKGPIMCLVGPPGVGKTSLGKSIAKATGREFIRISLGGVRDEAEIRGHRRTYIGSMPGKIIQSMKKAKTTNPVILLDEIDKMGQDFRGDPASAMLEVLDPEQNSTFADHYLEVDYDLSNVMFITTANTMNMPRPLLDRMEVLRLSGYTEEEKVEIAKRHLIEKQREGHGLKAEEFKIEDEALTELTRTYTREAGVRSLEREIAKLARKSITKIVKDGAKSVTITQVPDGATPKDGPSAGIGMVTSIVSVLTDIPVRKDVAMTGEVSLRGNVLPIGGLKEKLLAALRGGIKTVLIPQENEKDLREMPDSIKDGLEIIPVTTVDEVLKRALTKKPKSIKWTDADQEAAEARFALPPTPSGGTDAPGYNA